MNDKAIAVAYNKARRAVTRERNRKRMTKAELARRIGTSHVMIYKYESGIVRIPLVAFGQIAAALGCPIEVMLKGIKWRTR